MSIRRGYGRAGWAAVATALLLAACGDGTSTPDWAATGSVSPAPATSSAAAAVRGGCKKPAAPKGWGPLAFADDFTGTRLDTGRWSVYDSPAGKPPRDASRVTVGGGELRISGGKGADGRDVSGGLSNDVNLMYAHVDVCFRVDRGAGYSAIALLWPQSEKWPDDGEIDIAEVNRGARAYANSFVHNHANNDRLGHSTIADFTAWHVMSVDWTPDHVTFYLDGSKQWTVGLDDRTAGLVPTTSAMHLAIQLDQGCDAFVECRTAATPARVAMHVDWVRGYSYAGD
ncbi:glycoside hydrolase family 16 protein [Actinoplanes subtropicus]|uniref:glycoside hydrolase family 16 protein n=1 Tax=Actinoplanes subtropicus TaxID=543632 RepID=UPI0012F8A9BB|nr:glycoside hydrolase family 16 protein [Actinoplanes subtropicus]